MLAELLRRIEELENRCAQTMRLGKVVEVLAGDGAVRVILPDAGGMVSAPLPVLCRKSQDDKDYWLPDVGEQVVCLFLPFALEQGFVVGSFFSDVDRPPVDSGDKWHIKFADGTYLEYDRAAHALTAAVAGDINLTAAKTIKIKAGKQLTLVAPGLVFEGNITATGAGGAAGKNKFSGNLAVDGNVTSTGTITDAAGNTNHHSH